MNDNSYQRKQIWLSIFDTLLKFIGVVLGVWFGFLQFTRGQSHERTRQFEQNLWMKRIDCYQKMSSVIGILESSARTDKVDKASYRKSVDSFYKLYWGEMQFVSDSLVSSRLDDFRESVTEFNIDMYDKNNKNTEHALETLKESGDSLVKACQRSLNNSLKELSR